MYLVITLFFRFRYSAVVLCLGATWPRDLPLRGRQLSGIHFAMEFLENWQKRQKGNKNQNLELSAKDKNVLIIGGGDTGYIIFMINTIIKNLLL